MLDESEFKRWIESALRTLESAKVDHSHGFYSWACFKAHQAAEKAIKALLWGLGNPQVGHSLNILLVKLSELIGEVPETILEFSARLNKYYIPTRYPDVWSEGIPEEQYTMKESQEAISMVEDVIKWVRRVWESLRKE